MRSWHTAIYTTDDISGPLHAPSNKGGYANAYLTYIIDNYYDLPSTLVFIHTPASDAEVASSLSRLNIAYVQSEGYADLRCNPDVVCMPRDTGMPLGGTAAAGSLLLDYGTWFSLFGPQTKVPKMVAAPCCAEFAVSRDSVVKRPLGDYVRFHAWLTGTELRNEVGVKVFEYAWHIIFGKGAVQ
ncbi:Protein of unknown function (DUF3431) [Teratosphaeria destructans]|uniref:Uncharacterized protein n=1 Tax=Teratosphaeria destructans TaxID=418781 RepID=A0A9W7T0L9_9PEZI|nr:Protein of unknown function (DUF3431) [Teratosphaeria destructans]